MTINRTPHSWGEKACKNEDGFLLLISQFENKENPYRYPNEIL